MNNEFITQNIDLLKIGNVFQCGVYLRNTRKEIYTCKGTVLFYGKLQLSVLMFLRTGTGS
jgi:hypothetical protein